ncbi:hypothetical protein FLBR109950_03755 [Flavobacterium branchiophilum]|uniref:IPExxxVDY family protein n=1 Tax=Flavobacterium branchiophilum (strain FL-15) TaxID=1034807 RepID=G2Z6K1_FLABF|nr:hypothetical protein [Flavobacterium branchiophilum]CCB68366.1 Hypothetical protein FBFL15_0220 [Flavobacterium branchiophilum FL-15]
MKILTFFAKDKSLIDVFKVFLLTNTKLMKDFEDKDTIYFINSKTKRNEIYFHFIYNDRKMEFIRDYSVTNQKIIEKHFDDENFYFFDIQYKDVLFLNSLLIDFKKYIANDDKLNGMVLLSNENNEIEIFNPSPP